jgi:hypothetical protein
LGLNCSRRLCSPQKTGSIISLRSANMPQSRQRTFAGAAWSSGVIVSPLLAEGPRTEIGGKVNPRIPSAAFDG